MTASRRIVILHPPGPLPAELPAVVRSLEDQGALVKRVELGDRYDDALDGIAWCDSVIVWR